MNREDLLDLIVKWTARAIQGPMSMGRSVKIASLAVAEHITRLFLEPLADDIRRIKDADISIKEAEAAKRVSEAAAAANEVGAQKRRDQIDLNEKRSAMELAARRAGHEDQKAAAEALKAREEAEALRIVNAKARFDLAVRMLRLKSGNIVFDQFDFKKMLGDVIDPQRDDQHEEPEAEED